MERNIIVYFGMGFLPEQNAVACREQVLSFLSKESGYIPVLIGINKEIPFNSYKKYNHDNVCCYDIKYAKTPIEKLKDTYVIRKTLISIFEDIGVEKIKCFIMQDYQFGPMKYLKKYCKANGIAFVADIMDWFVPARYCSLVKNISKSIDTFLRMYCFYPRLDNKICITHKFEEQFKSKKNKNTMVLPSTCKDVTEELQNTKNASSNITISFAGCLGENGAKERVDWVIKSLYENKSSIEFNIIGITKETFLLRFPEFEKLITNNIHFWGQLPHQECIKILKHSDFSIIVRGSNKLTEFGFSSKICEAFAYGLPVIATNNSDNKLYIKDGISGYICDSNYDSLNELLAEIERLDKEEIYTMHQKMEKLNPLSPKNYIGDFSNFIDNLII